MTRRVKSIPPIFSSVPSEDGISAFGAAAPGERPSVDAHIEAAIGQNLRTLYKDVLDEPVPQRFVDLLDGLVEEAQS